MPTFRLLSRQSERVRGISASKYNSKSKYSGPGDIRPRLMRPFAPELTGGPAHLPLVTSSIDLSLRAWFLSFGSEPLQFRSPLFSTTFDYYGPPHPSKRLEKLVRNHGSHSLPNLIIISYERSKEALPFDTQLNLSSGHLKRWANGDSHYRPSEGIRLDRIKAIISLGFHEVSVQRISPTSSPRRLEQTTKYLTKSVFIAMSLKEPSSAHYYFQ